MLSNKTIFLCPLDWGLGHATRCVPIIKSLSENNTIIIGVTNLNRAFFDQHFPGLKKINVPSYNIHYSKYIPVWLKVLLQTQKIRMIIRAENEVLKKIVAENKIDVVISDNRFGLHHKRTENIFITHQLKVQSPLLPSLANKINLKYIHQFSKVWIPDYENKDLRLSGLLSDSENLKIPVKYIGPQSALEFMEGNSYTLKTIDYLILLSGIEPQRTLLEDLLVQKLKNSDKKIVLIRGIETSNMINKNITTINFASGNELKKLILNAETIICRSGYSTLMDLHLLEKKNLILIPTPGQTEQEYLAQYWSEKFGTIQLLQHQIKNYSF